MNTLGAVLAGGLGSRMGADKAAVEVDGLTMLDRVSSALLTVAARVVVLGENHRDTSVGRMRSKSPGHWPGSRRRCLAPSPTTCW